MKKLPFYLLSAAALTLAGFVFLLRSGPAGAVDSCHDDTLPPGHQAEIWIPGGRFTMGADDAYPEERPVREVEVEGFWIDAYAVTNAQFAAFVADTGYVTVAEQIPDPAAYPDIPPEKLVPGSVVFVSPADFKQGFEPLSWWRFVPGANWREPEGPGSDIRGRDHFPVVHVAYEDALAYARWAGRDLPTEEQWEYAARGGLEGARYAWGDELTPQGKHQANSWQGLFPVENTAQDGFAGLAPVGCYKPNGYGLFDMIGNVWEWTTDPYDNSGAFRVIKGGSHLCAPNYCMRYRPSARQPGEAGLGSAHIGFRTVRTTAQSGPS